MFALQACPCLCLSGQLCKWHKNKALLSCAFNTKVLVTPSIQYHHMEFPWLEYPGYLFTGILSYTSINWHHKIGGVGIIQQIYYVTIFFVLGVQVFFTTAAPKCILTFQKRDFEHFRKVLYATPMFAVTCLLLKSQKNNVYNLWL